MPLGAGRRRAGSSGKRSGRSRAPTSRRSVPGAEPGQASHPAHPHGNLGPAAPPRTAPIVGHLWPRGSGGPGGLSGAGLPNTQGHLPRLPKLRKEGFSPSSHLRPHPPPSAASGIPGSIRWQHSRGSSPGSIPTPPDPAPGASLPPWSSPGSIPAPRSSPGCVGCLTTGACSSRIAPPHPRSVVFPLLRCPPSRSPLNAPFEANSG